MKVSRLTSSVLQSTINSPLSTINSQGGTLEEGVFFALLCVPKYVFPAFKAFKVAFIALFVPFIALSVNFPVDYLYRFLACGHVAFGRESAPKSRQRKVKN
ncbi:MAG: hypothetical protein IJZ86_10340 [Bacteroides sp.]|nr:hypothetical protein [Bacteroides sp.]